jgi:DNA-binding transcriptional MerR regulator
VPVDNSIVAAPTLCRNVRRFILGSIGIALQAMAGEQLRDLNPFQPSRPGETASIARGRMQYRIGEFAKLSGTSVKTLRYYDELGLLRPACVDSRTGYRHYRASQLQEIAAIRSLKDLGATLDDIRRVVGKDGSDKERRKLLEKLRMRARHTLQVAQHSLHWIELALEQGSATRLDIPVTVKQHPIARIVSMRAQVQRYSEIAGLERDLERSVQVGWKKATRGVLWHRCADSGAIEGEPFIEIGTGQRSYVSGLTLRELPAATVACAYCDSDDRAAEQTYEAIDRWLHARDYRLAGPKREIYVGGILEVQFPVLPG